MDPADAGRALGMGDLRSLAVKAFGDEEMAHAMYAMKGGTLHQKLNWMAAEGSNWKLVRPLLVDPDVPDGQKTELYQQNYLRRFFSDVCGDDEMEEAVGLLGGTLEAQLNWMFVEGTSVAAVRRRISAHKPEQRAALYKYDYMRDFFAELVGDDGMAQMVDLIGGSLNDRLQVDGVRGHQLRRRRGADPHRVRHRLQDGHARHPLAPAAGPERQRVAPHRGDARPRGPQRRGDRLLAQGAALGEEGLQRPEVQVVRRDL